MVVEPRKRRFTVDEFLRMDEAGIFDDQRVELWDGEIYEMSPIGPPHQGDVDALTSYLIRGLGSRAIVRTQGPVIIDDFTLPQPDLAVLRARADWYRTGHPRPADVVLLVEVADSSLRRDRSTKVPRYGAVGVAESWLVDIPSGRLEVYRGPHQEGYRSRTILGPGEHVSLLAFPDVTIPVADILG